MSAPGLAFTFQANANVWIVHRPRTERLRFTRVMDGCPLGKVVIRTSDGPPLMSLIYKIVSATQGTTTRTMKIEVGYPNDNLVNY
jgi:hypothetical protein